LNFHRTYEEFLVFVIGMPYDLKYVIDIPYDLKFVIDMPYDLKSVIDMPYDLKSVIDMPYDLKFAINISYDRNEYPNTSCPDALIPPYFPILRCDHHKEAHVKQLRL
jgi:hypothetical protein